MKSLLMLLTIFISSPAFAADKEDAQHLKGVWLKYYKSIAEKNSELPKLAYLAGFGRDRDRCDDDGKSSCVQEACKHGGANCNFSSDLEKVAQACRGVRDGNCIKEVCAQGGLNCIFSSDLFKVIEGCRQSRGQCVKVACSMGGANCIFSSDLEKVVKACRGVDEGCLESICKQGGLNCVFSSDLFKAMEMCQRR